MDDLFEDINTKLNAQLESTRNISVSLVMVPTNLNDICSYSGRAFKVILNSGFTPCPFRIDVIMTIYNKSLIFFCQENPSV